MASASLIQILSGGQSIKVAMSIASAQTPVLTAESYNITPDTTCFVRTGANPVAVADGTDQIMIANQTYRVIPILPGNKIAFILGSGTGNVYLTPNA